MYAVIVVDDVSKFIHGLEKPIIAKVIRAIELLERFGYRLSSPYVKKLNKDIWELRIRGKQEIRILFAINNSKYFLLLGFVKKSQKTPKRHIEKALELCKSIRDL